MSEDQARTPTLALVLRAALERRLSEVHTAMPGRVESYDASAQTVDVQPLLKAPAATEGGGTEALSMPVLTALPVCFPAAGGFRLVLPVKKGDTGWIMFSEASLDAWQDKGGLVDPGDPRRFHLSDAVFLPGLHAKDANLTGANADDASFGKDGAHQVVITPDVIELGGNIDSRPTDYVALASPTKSELEKLHDAINAGFGKLRSDLSSLKDHTHLIGVGSIQTAGSPVKQANVSPVQVPKSDGLSGLQDPADCGSIDDVKSAIVKSK